MSLARVTLARRAEVSDTVRRSAVRTRRDHRALHIVLDRPERLNALDHEMTLAAAAALEESLELPDLSAVVLSGAGERGLSTGLDLTDLAARATDADAVRQRWHALQELAAAVADHTTPVVTVMDGLVLGAGLSIAARAQVRIVTERSVLGMPGTRVGLLPGPGGLELLGRIPGELGTYLALSGDTVGAVDALQLGLADHFVWSHDLPALLDRLAVEQLDDALARFTTDPTEPAVLSQHLWLADCLAGRDVHAVLECLGTHPEMAAREAAELIAARSPAAVFGTLRALRDVAGLTGREIGEVETELAVELVGGPDFAEGVRARLEDKDRNPCWRAAG